MTVDVNSVGSIKDDIKFWRPIVVLCKLLAKVKLLTKFVAEERYPAEPNPWIVDCKVEFRKGVETKLLADER
jgi:hypothetical protein